MKTPGIAHSPVLWLAAAGVFAVIVVQCLVYLRAARRAAPDAGMSRAELRTAMRTGAVSAIGPSVAVVFLAITLLTVFGAPAVLVRIGLIGSASFETLSARTAAEALGVQLGGAGYDDSAFALVLFTMSVGGAAWMVSALVCTPLLRRGDRQIRALNPAVMAVAPSAGMIGAFSFLGLDQVQESSVHLITFAVGALAALGIDALTRVLKVGWLKEWSLTIGMAAALVAAGIAM
jgi:hypothetical protein